jgi:Nitrile hydratase, alpha chain
MVMVSDQQKARESAKKHGRLVARTWSDSALKERLLINPAAVLREHGFDVPAGTEVRVIEPTDTATANVIEQTDNVIYFSLPAKPGGWLGDEELTGRPTRGGQPPNCTATTGPNTNCSNCTGPACS